MKHLLFVALQFSTVAFGQTSYATFSADTTRIHHERSRMTVFEKIMESECQINGQTLTYGSTPIRVETDNQVDTIFFRQDKNARWDTLICSISRPTNYTFYYNECCGGFNTADETGTYLVGAVKFENRNPKKGKHYWLKTFIATSVKRYHAPAFLKALVFLKQAEDEVLAPFARCSQNLLL